MLFQTSGEPDNNHMLFTLLAKLSVASFGLSEFTLRLPTLLGFAVFLGGIKLVLQRLVPGWVQVIGIAAIGLNPYLVDYFSIARGYGLALGLMTLGLACLIAAMCDTPGAVGLGKARAALFLFALAALANLAFLLPLLAAIAIVCSPMLDRRARSTYAAQLRQTWAMVWPILPILLYLIRPMVVLARKGLLAAGGNRGFWLDTVGSLIDGTSDAGAYLAEARWPFIAWIAAVTLIAPFVLASLRAADRRRFAALAIVGGMLLLAAVGSVAQHWIFGVALLEGRRALFFIPLFLLFALALAAVPRVAPRPLVAAALAVGILAPSLLIVHNLSAMNLRYVRDWKFDAASRETMLATKAWLAAHPLRGPARMRVNWILGPSSNFYRATLGLESLLLPIDWRERPGFEGVADLYYVETRDEQAIAKFDVRILQRSTVAGTSLLERAPASSRAP